MSSATRRRGRWRRRGGVLATALAALPLWHGTPTRSPPRRCRWPRNLAAAAERLRTAEAGLRACSDALARRDATLAQIAAELQGYLAAGDLPSEAAIGAARQRRDRAWHLLRRQIEGGAAASAEELADLDATGTLPATFEALLRAADALADRRAGDLTRLAKYDHARAGDAQERALRADDAAAEQAADATLAAAQGGWATLWQPVGVTPLDPNSMRDGGTCARRCWRSARRCRTRSGGGTRSPRATRPPAPRSPPCCRRRRAPPGTGSPPC